MQSTIEATEKTDKFSVYAKRMTRNELYYDYLIFICSFISVYNLFSYVTKAHTWQLQVPILGIGIAGADGKRLVRHAVSCDKLASHDCVHKFRIAINISDFHSSSKSLAIRVIGVLVYY